MKKTIEVEITKKDLALLEKYGFYIERNVQEYLKAIAEEIRACEKAQKGERA